MESEVENMGVIEVIGGIILLVAAVIVIVSAMLQ